MRRSAAITVDLATSYSAASSATGGKRSPDFHSPAATLARSAVSTRWLGGTRPLSGGTSP